jgi:hypothetical protein
MTESQQALRDAIPLNTPEQEQEYIPGESQSPGRKIAFLIGGLILLAAAITSFVFLLQPGTDTARVRDIFIIFMALEFLLIGCVMIVLIVQIARLTLLLQNEIKPILESTSETANTLRGTTVFLSEHLVEPILKLNQYLAGMNRIIGIFRSDED